MFVPTCSSSFCSRSFFSSPSTTSSCSVSSSVTHSPCYSSMYFKFFIFRILYLLKPFLIPDLLRHLFVIFVLFIDWPCYSSMYFKICSMFVLVLLLQPFLLLLLLRLLPQPFQSSPAVLHQPVLAARPSSHSSPPNRRHFFFTRTVWRCPRGPSRLPTPSPWVLLASLQTRDIPDRPGTAPDKGS